VVSFSLLKDHHIARSGEISCDDLSVAIAIDAQCYAGHVYRAQMPAQRLLKAISDSSDKGLAKWNGAMLAQRKSCRLDKESNRQDKT